jgi:hypothetical protein
VADHAPARGHAAGGVMKIGIKSLAASVKNAESLVYRVHQKDFFRSEPKNAEPNQFEFGLENYAEGGMYVYILPYPGCHSTIRNQQ